jgi:hypothetical protein
MNLSAYSTHLAVCRSVAAARARRWSKTALANLVHFAPVLIMALVLLSPEFAFAADGGVGGIFDKIGSVLEQVAEDLTKSGWLKWIGVLAIAIGGVLFSVGELSGPFGYVIRIIAGLAVALGAGALAATFTAE